MYIVGSNFAENFVYFWLYIPKYLMNLLVHVGALHPENGTLPWLLHMNRSLA